VREVGAGEANVELGLTREGKLYLLTTVPDTGTGAHTIFRQIAAEILGVSADTIEVVLGTTDSFPTDVTVAASRVTFLGGQATQRAALQLLNLLTEHAARYLGCPASRVTRGHGLFHSAAKEKLSLSELALKAFSDGITLSSKGNFKMEQRTGSACFFGQAAEVEVDAETGKVTILKILSAYDVGTIINPLAHQGQVEGGMIQGLGFALIENLVDEEGRIATANLGEYKIPNILDVPKHETLLINDNEGPGPFQSKPIGEHSAVPTAPCIANAVYDALGVQITDLPLDAEKIYFALKNRAPVPCEHRVPATARRPSRQGSHRKNRRV
jgi:CO/xanthine dehydrogenase Mo-binding subunit